MRVPDFFIVGAPKCGTTSVSHYLSEHPAICFSYPKEPHYFSTDFPHYGFTGSVHQYMKRFFPDFIEEHLLIGEGSTWYLYSHTATINIMKVNPKAKIIAIIRNPIDMVYSLHSQHLYSFKEDVVDFAKAWRMQNVRRQGKCIPARCKAPTHLLYYDVACYSKQIKRVYDNVPNEQVLIIVFDDLKNNVKLVYKNILTFLEVDDDGREVFPVLNMNKAHRYELLGSTIKAIDKRFKKINSEIKKMFGVRSLNLLSAISKMNTEKIARPPLPHHICEMLRIAFQAEVEELSYILSRDLTHWLV